MRRSLPATIVVVVGLLLLINTIVINPLLAGAAGALLRLVVLVAAGAALAGALALAMRHGAELLRPRGDRLEAFVLLAGLAAMLVVGLYPGSQGVADPAVRWLVAALLAEAHRRTDTLERRDRSTTEYLGEGRATVAAAALATGGSPAANLVAGGLGEDGLLLLAGSARGAAWTSFGTAAPSQAASVLLTGGGAMIGPELFQATSDNGARADRTGILAANRLVWAALAVIGIGSLLAWLAGVDVTAALVGS